MSWKNNRKLPRLWQLWTKNKVKPTEAILLDTENSTKSFDFERFAVKSNIVVTTEDETNVHSYEIMRVIEMVNNIAADLNDYPPLYVYDYRSDDTHILAIEHLANTISPEKIVNLKNQCWAAHDQLTMGDKNNDMVRPILVQLINYTAPLYEAAQEFEATASDYIHNYYDGLRNEEDFDYLGVLEQELYNHINLIMLYLKRAGDKFDQFVINFPSPDERYEADYDLLPDDFPVDLIEKFASPGSIDEQVNPYSLKLSAFNLQSTKHNLNIGQLNSAFERIYKRIMSVNGGWILSNQIVSGVTTNELNALVEEGLVKLDGKLVTLTRQGYMWPNAPFFQYPPNTPAKPR